ncbi:MAG: hypothetical protein QM426_03865 [Euryarchaeota archaeon]|nr:hypothetical protein [Euryarchaeota archaeon]
MGPLPIQFNFFDEGVQAGIEGLKYAAEKGLAVVIMKALRDGNLASNILGSRKVWDKAEVKRAPAGFLLATSGTTPKSVCPE